MLHMINASDPFARIPPRKEARATWPRQKHHEICYFYRLAICFQDPHARLHISGSSLNMLFIIVRAHPILPPLAHTPEAVSLPF
jgi:hypothetical protein